MQDRYAGDVGDYVKLALLRRLGVGRKLGLAWYRFPDEAHNSDGSHTTYLERPEVWRYLDPGLFDGLADVVASERSIANLVACSGLAGVSVEEPLLSGSLIARERSDWRAAWFQRLMAQLEGQDFIFADPDNGLTDDDPKRRRTKGFGKSIPLSEARALAKDRAAVIYHHNTRRKGGHELEVGHWLEQLGTGTLAIRANAWSCRTFFVVNPDAEMRVRAEAFCKDWSRHNVLLQEA